MDVAACTENGVILTIQPDGVRRPVAVAAINFHELRELIDRIIIRWRGVDGGTAGGGQSAGRGPSPQPLVGIRHHRDFRRRSHHVRAGRGGGPVSEGASGSQGSAGGEQIGIGFRESFDGEGVGLGQHAQAREQIAGLAPCLLADGREMARHGWFHFGWFGFFLIGAVGMVGTAQRFNTNRPIR